MAHKLKTTTTENTTRFFFIFLLLLSSYSSYSQGNLLTNGGFEDGWNGWTTWGAWPPSTSHDSHTGTYAFLVTDRKESNNSLVRDISGILKNGETYTLSAWIKIPDTAINLNARLAINANGSYATLSFFQSPNPQIGSYSFYKDSLTISWNGELESANLYFELEGVDGVYSDYLVDDVILEGEAANLDALPVTNGLKNIKSTMLVGGFVTEGYKNYFTNAKARAQVLTDCNIVTIGCFPHMGTWNTTDKFVFHVDDFNNKVKEIKSKNLNVTALLLTGWDLYYPEWWYQDNSLSADSIETIMENWMDAIISYKGNDTLVDIWAVVNEAINWDGHGGYWPEETTDMMSCHFQKMGYEPDSSGLTGDMFVNEQHPVYIRKAFEFARTLTDKKLELRDAGFEFPTDQKYKSFYQLAVHLKNIGAPVDVISFQTHLDMEPNYDWEGYSHNIKRFIQLGYEVGISEVDIGDKEQNESEENLSIQKMKYYRLVTSAIKGGASYFQLFGFIDNNIYDYRVDEYPLPFTHDFEPKPAYYGIKEALVDMSHILFWEMDTIINDTVPDVMKYQNDGSLNNFDTPTIVEGFKSNALEFDGADDYISTGILSDTISGDFTFSCFITTSTLHSGTIADLAVEEAVSGLKIGIDDNGYLYLNHDEAGLTSNLASTIPINDNTWHFIALQRDSITYRLYLDDEAPIAIGEGSVSEAVKLVLGATIDGSNAFGGIIDEVKLYDSAIEEESFIRNMTPLCPIKLEYTQNDKIINLSWIDQSNNDDGFIIERKIENNSWEEYASTYKHIFTFSDTTELFNTQYSYRIRAYNKFGKSNPSNSVTLISPDISSLQLTDENNASCSVFPNPVENTFTLISHANSNVQIINVHGRVVFEKNNLTGNDILDINDIADGIYLVKILTNEKTEIVKIIKL